MEDADQMLERCEPGGYRVMFMCYKSAAFENFNMRKLLLSPLHGN